MQRVSPVLVLIAIYLMHGYNIKVWAGAAVLAGMLKFEAFTHAYKAALYVFVFYSVISRMLSCWYVPLGEQNFWTL